MESIKELLTGIYGVPYLPEGIISAITLYIVQLLKGYPKIRKEFYPVIALAVAILLAVGNALLTGVALMAGIIKGIIIGLTACGLYSNIRVPKKVLYKVDGNTKNR